MRVLITGSNGQLGSEIKELENSYNKIDFIFKDLPELDICNSEALETFIIDHKINIANFFFKNLKTLHISNN